MKKLRVQWVLGLIVLFTFSAFSQITSIKDIQYTGGPAGDSPLIGQTVTISGIVTAEHRGDVTANGGISGSYFFVMDSAGAWSGIQILYDEDYAAEGDSVTITGVVGEYNNQTQIDVSQFTVHDSLRELPGPIDVTTEAADTSEAYEGCLVRVTDVEVTEIEIGTYDNWRIDDGSGDVEIDTRAEYYYTPALDDSLKSLTGIILSYKDEYTIAPRLAWDIVEAGKFTRIQRIQQVRNSDLLRTPDDDMKDMSYSADTSNRDDSYRNYETLNIRGVVTMPTGLSFAGAGVKFILAEEEGGPWSAILSYNPDSTTYPILYEGDLVEMTGDVGEYRTDYSNMTEFWSTTDIDIVDTGVELPQPDFVNTGDLRLPITAEQWGNVMVYVKDATVVDVNPAFEMFALDDGTGSVLVDDDSDSLAGYVVPPLGTIADSIRGWIYHHYGSYTDSSTYKLEPLYTWDILWGAGPPAITNVTRDVDIPSSIDIVTVQADIATNLTISEAALYYEVITGSSSTGYTKITMNNVSGNTYAGQIPEQAAGSFVNYFIVGTDDKAQSTTLPADTSIQNLCYTVIDGAMTLKDIQYTPWELADSPFEGVNVEVTGIVTVDTTANNKYQAYSIQDTEAEWSGLFAFGITDKLNRGDQINVYGTVTDYNPDWGFKWDNNTVILTDSIKVIDSGNSINPISVTTGKLTNFESGAESYEGVIVKIANATLISVNSYDVTFDDGSGECLVDGDFMLSADQDQNDIFYVNRNEGYLMAFGDTLRPGNKVESIQGVFTWSFGTYKIEIRDADDFGSVVGIDPNYKPVPLTYDLKQNFPNPFNPETRIYFEIPQMHDVKLIIYNILGQKVRTLVDDNFNAGRHIVNWDGRNDAGIQAPTGVYIYRIKAGKFISSRKMLMVK